MAFPHNARQPWTRFTMICAALVCVLPGTVNAQSAFYTFSSGPGGDGFVWDFDDPPDGLNDLPTGEAFFAPPQDGNGLNYLENYTGNATFFDTNYQAAGNSAVINGDAWWGNPSDDDIPTVGAYFFDTPNGSIATEIQGICLSPWTTRLTPVRPLVVSMAGEVASLSM
jgi:hypothetical protein